VNRIDAELAADDLHPNEHLAASVGFRLCGVTDSGVVEIGVLERGLADQNFFSVVPTEEPDSRATRSASPFRTCEPRSRDSANVAPLAQTAEIVVSSERTSRTRCGPSSSVPARDPTIGISSVPMAAQT
jgi:hypothetical protein